MNSFVVYVKTRSTGDSGHGVIYQNGIRCGENCTIAVPLPDLPVLWKLEAKPLADSSFAGWESETGQPLTGKHKPLPGDTIYAVFGETFFNDCPGIADSLGALAIHAE